MLPSDLQAASFRGARFLVPRDESEEGRNAVCHEYPDASFRYVEDNGYIPPRFTLPAVLHGPDLGSKLQRLRSALNAPGPGVLKHPHYGTQFVQVDGTYKVSRDDRSAGTIELEIKFAVTGAPVLPGLLSGIAAVVTGLAASAIVLMFQEFQAEFDRTASASVTTHTATAGALFDVADVLDRSFGRSTDAASRIANEATFMVRNPEILKNLLVAAYRDPFDDDSLSTRELIDGFSATAAAAALVSESALTINASTADLARRQSALMVLGATLEAASMACLADAMASHAYSTGEEIDRDEQALANLVDAVQSRELSATVHEAITKIYLAASNVLRDVDVRLPRIAEIATAPIPASVLAYQLYESDADLMRLVDLNLSKDPILMQGPVSALSIAI